MKVIEWQQPNTWLIYRIVPSLWWISEQICGKMETNKGSNTKINLIFSFKMFHSSRISRILSSFHSTECYAQPFQNVLSTNVWAIQTWIHHLKENEAERRNKKLANHVAGSWSLTWSNWINSSYSIFVVVVWMETFFLLFSLSLYDLSQHGWNMLEAKLLTMDA